MNSLKEKSDSERVLLRQSLTKVRACMCSTSRRLAYGRLRSSFSPLAAKPVCIFLLCVIWRIASGTNSVSLPRQSELSKDINRKAGNEMPEPESVEAGARGPTRVSGPRALATGSFVIFHLAFFIRPLLDKVRMNPPNGQW